MAKQSICMNRILIVDDEPAICQLGQRVLTGRGFEVETAANGKVAQSKINEQEYGLYLFDIKMPLMDGKELFEFLKKTYPGSAERVVFTTGSALGAETEGFLQNCGRPVLRKPFTISQLREVVEEFLK